MGYWADLSEFQGVVDFAKVKPTVDGCILRVQSGSSHPDKNYTTYVAGCKSNSIPYGSYAYGKFVSVSDAQQEAKDAFTRMDKGSQFFVVDVEEVTTYNASDLVPSTQAYIDYLHAQGVKKVGLYSGDYFYKQHGLANVKADFLWIANYGVNDGAPHNPPSIPCDLWQFTSVGHIPGVTQNTIDLSKYNGAKSPAYFTGAPQFEDIVTGGYVGEALGKVHNQIFYSGLNYTATVNPDRTLTLTALNVQIGSSVETDLLNLLKSNGWWYQCHPK